MFFAKSPTDHFGVYESGPDGSYTATAMNGPKMYMPPPTAYVANSHMPTLWAWARAQAQAQLGPGP